MEFEARSDQSLSPLPPKNLATEHVMGSRDFQERVTAMARKLMFERGMTEDQAYNAPEMLDLIDKLLNRGAYGNRIALI
jgi:hypothetical protein